MLLGNWCYVTGVMYGEIHSHWNHQIQTPKH